LGVPNHTLTRIATMLEECRDPDRAFPATVLYNEGWMLRAVLDWFSRQLPADHPLSFRPKARWFSEGLLPSQFRPRTRTDNRAETRTHADGMVGHIDVSKTGRADITLLPDATQCIVLEAKLFSKLSAGVKNAPDFDQAARNVACLAEVLCRAGRPPADVPSLAFYVVAPASQVSDNVFADVMTKDSIQRKVLSRAEAYRADRIGPWLDNWFLPTLAHVQVACLTWEALLDYIRSTDPQATAVLADFYTECVRFNRPPDRGLPRQQVCTHS
jgi:hypothetical protein